MTKFRVNRVLSLKALGLSTFMLIKGLGFRVNRVLSLKALGLSTLMYKGSGV